MDGTRKDNDIKEIQKNALYNMNFVIKKIIQYDKSTLFLLGLVSIIRSIVTFFSIYSIKVIIDIVMNSDKWGTLAIFIITFLLVISFLEVFDKLIDVKLQKKIMYVRGKIYQEFLKKSHIMSYEKMENPTILDYQERAKCASFFEGSGISNMITYLLDIFVTILNIIVALVAVAVVSRAVIFAVFILSGVNYLILEKMKVWDKINTWDVLAPISRKLNYYGHISEDSSFAKEIRINDLSEWLNDAEREEQNKAIIIKNKHYRKWIECNNKMIICETLQSVVLYSWLVYMVIFKGLTVANFTFYLGLVASFSDTITHFFDLLTNIKQYSLQINDFHTYMNIETDNQKIAESKFVEKYKNVFIKFDNVSYRYLGQDSNTLSNINLEIKKREKIAIVGMNGAGKTTFIKLLSGLYTPTEGEIYYYGRAISTIEREDWYKIIAPVFQESECICMNVAENVAMSENYDVGIISKSLERAGIYKKIEEYGKGLNLQLKRMLYEEGIELSGGEKQKLFFARALYKGAQIVILDEPTASLDPIAEMKMYTFFNESLKDKTAIYISHRLSSTKFCDRIMFFKNGQVIEMGTHNELIKLDGEYKKVYKIQSENYRVERYQDG